MHPLRVLRPLASLGLLGVLATTSQAADANEKTSFDLGPAVAWLESPGGDADMAGAGGTARLHLGELLAFDTSLRGSYTYLNSTDSTDYERQDVDIDFVLSGSLIGFLAPFGTIGVSYDYFDAAGYSGGSDWDPGYALGAGVEITVLPALLSVTPAVRYVDADHLDTVTWSLDAQFHFTVFAVGARASYEDNRSRDGDITGVTAYVALRF